MRKEGFTPLKLMTVTEAIEIEYYLHGTLTVAYRVLELSEGSGDFAYALRLSLLDMPFESFLELYNYPEEDDEDYEE